MNKIVKEALTFDDVLLIPAASSVLPATVDLHTTLCKGINLNIPLELLRHCHTIPYIPQAVLQLILALNYYWNYYLYLNNLFF